MQEKERKEDNPNFSATLYQMRSLFDDQNKKVIKSKRSALCRILGKNRLEHIQQRHPKLFNFINDDVIKLTRQDFQKLCYGIANVHLIDLEELIGDISTSETTIRDSNEEKSRQLRQHFAGKKSLSECNKEDIDVLMNVLVPFKTFEDIFMGDVPTLPNSTGHAGKGLEGLISLVYYVNHLRLKVDDRVEYYYRLGKRVIDHEPAVGTIIPHLQGYYTVFPALFGTASDTNRLGVIFEGGAYAVPLKAITPKSENFRNIILCRGTRAFKPKGTSWKQTMWDNLRQNQGADGVMQIYDRLNALISDPAQNYIDDANEQIWVLGMSLGGVHVERLMVAFYDRISRLVCQVLAPMMQRCYIMRVKSMGVHLGPLFHLSRKSRVYSIREIRLSITVMAILVNIVSMIRLISIFTCF